MIRLPVPLPEPDESPVAYADRLGRAYAASVSDEHRKRLGQYMTPVAVARFMAGFYREDAQMALRILDPGAGGGVLSCAICEKLAANSTKPAKIELVAYEIDAGIADCLAHSLAYAKHWLQTRGILLEFTLRRDDFILANGAALENTLSLFSISDGTGAFDIIIANPPYFKLPKSDPRACAAEAVVHGQPNIYALFMAFAAALLRPDGLLIVITPRSYAAGPYFRRFREYFFANMRPEVIHLFGSRRDAFSQDEILQENVILLSRRCQHWAVEPDGRMVTVSFSAGLSDLAAPEQRQTPLLEILDMGSRDKLLRIPVTPTDDAVVRTVGSWSGSLHAYGMQISTGPVVAFRAADLLAISAKTPTSHAPLLWMQNVRPMRIQWPVALRDKEQYIKLDPAAAPLLLVDRNYVILRRFSAKEQERRLTAAPLLAGQLGAPYVGLENHLNYIYRPGGALTSDETYGLSALLNSTLLDRYFRTFNGNTQVSATELRAMPLPPLAVISELGRRVRVASVDIYHLDALIGEILGLDGHISDASWRDDEQN